MNPTRPIQPKNRQSLFQGRLVREWRGTMNTVRRDPNERKFVTIPGERRNVLRRDTGCHPFRSFLNLFSVWIFSFREQLITYT